MGIGGEGGRGSPGAPHPEAKREQKKRNGEIAREESGQRGVLGFTPFPVAILIVKT